MRRDDDRGGRGGDGGRSALPVEPCRHFAAGRCRRGERCPYGHASHDGADHRGASNYDHLELAGAWHIGNPARRAKYDAARARLSATPVPPVVKTVATAVQQP